MPGEKLKQFLSAGGRVGEGAPTRPGGKAKGPDISRGGFGPEEGIQKIGQRGFSVGAGHPDQLHSPGGKMMEPVQKKRKGVPGIFDFQKSHRLRQITGARVLGHHGPDPLLQSGIEKAVPVILKTGAGNKKAPRACPSGVGGKGSDLLRGAPIFPGQ